ncbi:MAG TPA: type II toxin-antitoxin system RelE/ParE family toxin [Hanamia sp.]
MILKIVVEQKAINEIASAMKWYSEKSLIASENFEREINEAFNYLQSTIAEHRKIFSDIRVLSLKVFPYNIYYLKKDTNNKISIIAFLHNKRSSDFIKTRLKV